MLQNAYLVAKIGADTAENEQQFAEILPIGSWRRPTSAAARTPEQLKFHHSLGAWASLPPSGPVAPATAHEG